MTKPDQFKITSDEAYAIIVGALDVFASLTPNTFARITRDYGPEGKGFGSFPTVDPRALLNLRAALEDVWPGVVADVIERSHKERLAARRAERGPR